MPSPSSTQFEALLKQVAGTIDASLDGLLPEVGENRLRAAMRYAVLGQGKRLRPFFVLETAKLHGIPVANALRVGAAVECVHCYSLVHDDLPAMDNDDLRRGQPTTHRKFDEATAILAGDGLLTFAFEIAADAATHGDAAVRSEIIMALAKASGEAGMVGGQMLDIEAETRNFKSVAEISAMQAMKTGALFRFSCMAGAIMAKADQAPLGQYSDHIGLAFQIADDILDVESNSADLGKATQKDKSKGKATFVDLLGMAAAKREAHDLVQRACDAVSIYGGKAQQLQQAAHFVIARRK